MVQFLEPETDIMVQFLEPETDIMGERNYIAKGTYENAYEIISKCNLP